MKNKCTRLLQKYNHYITFLYRHVLQINQNNKFLTRFTRQANLDIPSLTFNACNSNLTTSFFLIILS